MRFRSGLFPATKEIYVLKVSCIIESEKCKIIFFNNRNQILRYITKISAGNFYQNTTQSPLSVYVHLQIITCTATVYFTVLPAN